jgi:hypothetical protein
MTERLLVQLRAQLLTPKQTAQALGRSMRSLERWRDEGIGPESIKFGGRYNYLREDVIAFLSSRAKPDKVRQNYLDAPLQSGKTAGARDGYRGGGELDSNTRNAHEILIDMITRVRKDQQQLSKRLDRLERKRVGTKSVGRTDVVYLSGGRSRSR